MSDQANEFKTELAKLRAELVSRVQFEGLEKRVVELEAGGLASSRIDWLQDQLNRLDPANRSLSFSGFTSTSAAGRRANVEKFLQSVMVESVPICQVEHIFRGPSGDRKMSDLSIVELPSRAVREQVLKKVQDRHKGIMLEDDQNQVSVKRAKTAWQLKRNANLKQVVDRLKKDGKLQGKEPVIAWQLEGTKDRAVKVGDVVAFLQKPTDACGIFLAPYQNVVF